MSEKLPVVSGADCVRVLQKISFYIDRQRGSHIIMKRHEPLPTITLVVPDHKSVGKGTLRSIIRQAGLTVEEFVTLLKD